jgi:hypothetical protein
MTNKLLFGLCIVFTSLVMILLYTNTFDSGIASNTDNFSPMVLQPLSLLLIGLIAFVRLRKSISNK